MVRIDLKEVLKENNEKNNKILREETQNFKSDCPLVSLFYSLMRDHIPCGVLQKEIIEAVTLNEVTFTNGYLALYAEFLANSLKKKIEQNIIDKKERIEK